MDKKYELFNRETQSIIYNLNANAIQRMLDFDFMCKRENPSVAAIVRPTQTAAMSYHKVFFGTEEIVIPMYKTLEQAVKKHPSADVMINFSSFRSAYPTSKRALETETINTVVIIAEGVPERKARKLVELANRRGKWIIGPATVGGIVAGKFKIANAAGTVENLKLTKLYRPGSVGLVTKSGGMSNEMYFMISQNSDGIYEGVAIGGDRYPGSRLIDHCIRYEQNPNIKMIVVLGEVGGKEEYAIVEAMKEGKITKPVIAWVTGTAAKILPKGLQFGHAGAMAASDMEKADAKNKALKDAGALVPDSYDGLDKLIKETYEKLKEQGIIEEKEDFEPPELPMDFSEAKRKGIVRRPTDVVCTISDDRGDVPEYAGIGLDKIMQEEKSLGYVIGLLWFKKELPKYAQKFIEMILKLTADHGPAVSGAHNAIITARAGKDWTKIRRSNIRCGKIFQRST